jgi:O-antigen/teichoic acid export membrane protein
VYGVADIIVLAVGGFLLLPMYTRTLSQSELGIYFIVRANIEIFTFLLFFGLPSAVGRLYFDYKKGGQLVEYLSSVLMFFLLVLMAFSVVLSIWGTRLWAMLSPNTPVYPYLEFCLAIAAVSFFGAVTSIWLRMEGRVIAFVGLQVGSAVVLAMAAATNLIVLDAGLPGLLFALLISSTCTAIVLPWLLGSRFRPVIRWAHITESLRYAVPIMIGYIAYFVLNRISILILQRHVAVDQIAIFGLAQQLSMMVTIAAVAFGKAFQPNVYASEPEQAAEMIKRMGTLLMLLMFCITSLVVLFASDIFSLMAPKSYSSGYEILLLLLVGSFAYSFMQISDTALLYHRRPKTSVAVTIVGAALSASLGVWLIPLYQLHGAALASVGGFTAMTIISHWMAHRVTGHSYLAPMMLALAAICVLALFASWLQHQDFSIITSVGLKLVVSTLILSNIYILHIRKGLTKPCPP